MDQAVIRSSRIITVLRWHLGVVAAILALIIILMLTQLRMMMVAIWRSKSNQT